jgi:hypothetical protein
MMKMLQILLSRSVYSLFVIPEHLLQCHPFVAKSFLRVGRLDENEDEGEARSCSTRDDSDSGLQSSAEQEHEDEASPSDIAIRSDRP